MKSTSIDPYKMQQAVSMLQAIKLLMERLDEAMLTEWSKDLERECKPVSGCQIINLDDRRQGRSQS